MRIGKLAAAIVMSGTVGCSEAAKPSDRLEQGDRVILIDPSLDAVVLVNMREHVAANPNVRAFYAMGGTDTPITEELISTGTRARVISDRAKPDTVKRMVKIAILEGPCVNLEGEVPRNAIKPE